MKSDQQDGSLAIIIYVLRVCVCVCNTLCTCASVCNTLCACVWNRGVYYLFFLVFAFGRFLFTYACILGILPSWSVRRGRLTAPISFILLRTIISFQCLSQFILTPSVILALRLKEKEIYYRLSRRSITTASHYTPLTTNTWQSKKLIAEAIG